MPKKTLSSTSRGSSRGARPPSAKPPEAQPPVVAGIEPLVVSPPERIEPLVVSPAKQGEPRTHRELAEAIFAECGAVQVGCELLQSGSERGAAVRARMFETLANWQFGKPGPTAGAENVRVIWDMPRPPREHRDED
jgi:hypothetical protein